MRETPLHCSAQFSSAQHLDQFGEISHLHRRWPRLFMRPGVTATIDPQRLHAGLSGPHYVQRHVITDVQHLMRGNAGQLGSGMKKPCIRLAYPKVLGAQPAFKVRGKPDPR